MVPFAVILGTNEVASAVAVQLHRAGFSVVLSHDPMPPVIRRKMAFHDALFDDLVTLDGVGAQRAATGLEIRGALGRTAGVLVTELGLLDLLVVRTLDVLVDARMQKYQTIPDLRRLARHTIGLGPGFSAGSNCDIAIETRPATAGRILEQGPTEPADAMPPDLGGHAAERFVRAEVSGRWHTALEIGTRIFKSFVIGHLGNLVVRAPFDGILRGLVRDGTEVPAGSKLLEVDARGRNASWTGIDGRSRRIAKAVAHAIAKREAQLQQRGAPILHIVK